jgi:flagellin-like protein
MRKGITPIIAIIVLLLITIALAGAAWTFMNTYTESLTSKNVQMLDAYCESGTNATVVLKSFGTDSLNLGTNGVNDCDNADDITGTSHTCGDLTVSRTDGRDMAAELSADGTLAPGGTFTFVDGGCTIPNTARSCSYRFLVGSIAPVPTTVTCSG